MILQALYDLYDRLSRDEYYEICPPGFSLQKVAFRVVLTLDGALHAIEDARSKDPKGKPSPEQIRVLGQPKPSGSGLNPGTLWDTSQYLLGYKPEDDKPERTAAAFAAFRDKHLGLEKTMASPSFSAVCRFLEKWNPAEAINWPVLDEVGPGYGVFQILGQQSFVHQESAVEAWWLKQHTAGGGAVQGQCLVTGKVGPVARLQYKIKKIGSQGESQLVSFNDPPYESYGKEQSFNAPISEDAAFRYATALNALTDGPMRRKHRFTLGEATVVFWTKEPTNTEDIFAKFATGRFAGAAEAQDESVRQKIELFLKALRKGREAYAELDGKADQTPFHLLGLTGQARGRIGVRFFYTDRLSTLLDNLRRHYADMNVVRKFGEGTKHPDPEFPALWQILDETCPRDSKGKPMQDQIPPVLEGPLLRAVITGAQYPAGLFSAVMRRIHADREVNYVRACIIAGYLRRNQEQEVSMCLDTERKDPAYRLGRLFAVLEKVQGDALGKVNATVRDRFYSAASATPGVVFPRLLRTYQHHLGKLEGGAKVYFERLAQEILGPVTAFPTHMSLPEQGLFALGYYHQAKDLWTSKEEKAKDKGE